MAVKDLSILLAYKRTLSVNPEEKFQITFSCLFKANIRFLQIGGHGNILYAEVIKRGLPRRYERLHDNIHTIDASYGSILLFEYLMYHILMVAGIYMAVSSIMTGLKTSTFPWFE